jgi:hypothetical protein
MQACPAVAIDHLWDDREPCPASKPTQMLSLTRRTSGLSLNRNAIRHDTPSRMATIRLLLMDALSLRELIWIKRSSEFDNQIDDRPWAEIHVMRNCRGGLIWVGLSAPF